MTDAMSAKDEVEVKLIKTIPLSKPDLTGNERKYIDDAIDQGWISSRSPYVDRFENLFASKHNAKYGVAASSGTNALILALRAIGIKEGDEVIVPEFTMVATAWAVTVAGGKPVFVDCGLDGNINVAKLEMAITPKTKAIMPVHIYGRKANMVWINKIAHDWGLRVIVDACEAHGIPHEADITVFSLYGNKIITSGEGGICITNDKFFAEQMAHLRSMAFDENHTFIHKKLAYNFRMSGLQAAVALAQTERLEEFLAKRKQIEKWYDEGLSSLKGRNDFFLQPERDVVWFYDIRVAPNTHQKLMDYLNSHGIETRTGFKPMGIQPMYMVSFEATLAYKLSLELMYLPTYSTMTKEDVDYITSVIKDFYGQKDKELSPGEGGTSAPRPSVEKESSPISK